MGSARTIDFFFHQIKGEREIEQETNGWLREILVKNQTEKEWTALIEQRKIGEKKEKERKLLKSLNTEETK